MLVVAGSSPLSHLIRIQHVEILPKLYEVILIPPEIATELAHPAAPMAVQQFVACRPAWLIVEKPKHVDRRPKLHPGEAAAINLAQERRALLLIDETGVMVWFEHVPGPEYVNAYQLTVPMQATGGSSGTVRYVDNKPGDPGGDSIAIDTNRPDWFFYGLWVLPVVYVEHPKNGVFGTFYATIPGMCVEPCPPPGL